MKTDVIIIGGSYAGISAALQLARARRRITVIDAGLRRNRFASHSHGFLSRDAYWCRGISPITTRISDIGGMLNMPVSCGGVVVNPGDVILADENGVLVLPPGEVEEVAQAALQKQARQAANAEKIGRGERLGDLSGASAHVARAQ